MVLQKHLTVMSLSTWLPLNTGWELEQNNLLFLLKVYPRPPVYMKESYFYGITHLVYLQHTVVFSIELCTCWHLYMHERNVLNIPVTTQSFCGFSCTFYLPHSSSHILKPSALNDVQSGAKVELQTFVWKII